MARSIQQCIYLTPEIIEECDIWRSGHLDNTGKAQSLSSLVRDALLEFFKNHQSAKTTEWESI